MPVADQLRQAVVARGQAVFDSAVDALMADLRDAAPELTGATKRGLRESPVGAPPLLAVQVESTTPQGDYVEGGTTPHLILPRRSAALVFEGRDGTVFARRVDHPGSPARPWFRPVVGRWPRYLAEALGR